MTTSKALVQLSCHAPEALQGVTAFLASSDIRSAAAVWRPWGVACMTAALHRSCRVGEAALEAAKEHLVAVQAEDEKKSTQEVKADVTKAIASVRSTQERHHSLLRAISQAISLQRSATLPMETLKTEKVLEQLSEECELLQKQMRREDFTKGWADYMNLYGGGANKMQSMGRIGMSTYGL
mmetsp:Transcript_29343/g.74431  ORF Transcript_29343/g.74431 Transcript_29343/m.74431 type:complete len:181 (-) Transcript_29343:316-858(-)